MIKMTCGDCKKEKNFIDIKLVSLSKATCFSCWEIREAIHQQMLKDTMFQGIKQ